MTAEESRQLVGRFQAGDPDAYGQLYQAYRGEVHRYVRQRIRDPHTAEDLTHDVFVRALAGLDRWEWQDKDVVAWLVTIARNLITDHVKTARRRRTSPVAAFPESDVLSRIGSLRDWEAGTPEPTVIDRHRDRAVLTLLGRLTAEQRQCLVHRFVQELSVAETAAAMGRAEPAVKSLQYRAVRALAGHVDEGWR